MLVFYVRPIHLSDKETIPAVVVMFEDSAALLDVAAQLLPQQLSGIQPKSHKNSSSW
jgi:hypothetical protein